VLTEEENSDANNTVCRYHGDSNDRREDDNKNLRNLCLNTTLALMKINKWQ